MRKKIEDKIIFHNKAKVIAASLAKRYLALHDFNEAARWSDAAKAHRFAAEVLKEIIGQ
jgi:hypothetical protein